MTMHENKIKNNRINIIKNIIFVILALGLAFLVYQLLPGGQGGLDEKARLLAGLFVAALVLWATEIIPIAVTSLLVLAVAPVIGIFKTFNEAAAGFTSPVIFFVIASFIISLAVQKSGLARRMALWLINGSGTNSKRILLVFMAGCAIISAIMSNVPSCAIWMSLRCQFLIR